MAHDQACLSLKVFCKVSVCSIPRPIPNRMTLPRRCSLGLRYLLCPGCGGELIYEYDDDDGSNQQTIDEAILAFEGGDFELELGKLFVPFGEYFQPFRSGPLLEFGETRTHDWGATLVWTS